MTRILFSLGVSAALGGCVSKLEITNPNSPSQETALQNPRDASSRLIVGVLATYRGARAGSINSMGSYGRETYNMTPQDGRSVTGMERAEEHRRPVDAVEEAHQHALLGSHLQRLADGVPR